MHFLSFADREKTTDFDRLFRYLSAVTVDVKERRDSVENVRIDALAGTG